MRFARSFGVLLHPTSLPGPFGIGDLGPAATQYLDWLREAGAGWWQVLPLTPVGAGGSPYSSTSAFAGNPLLVSPELLVEEGLLDRREVTPLDCREVTRVDWSGAVALKEELLEKAWRRAAGAPLPELEAFAAAEKDWLDDYAVYAALRRAHGEAPWWQWPAPLAQCQREAVVAWRSQHQDEVRRIVFRQWLFHHQWQRVRQQAAARGVRVLGDAPIFVALDSADVWANRRLFRLDPEGRPLVVAGVPPDYFSAEGQLWGNPLYDWERLASEGYRWWIDRIAANLRLVDALRLDHFRGFAACWEIPAGATTAREGRWVAGPGRALFDALAAALGPLPLVAEDLGFITDDVRALRDELELPGMAILQFAFDPRERSAFLPYQHRRNLVVYTGTHDNNTVVGWYWREASPEVRRFFCEYAGSDGREVHWDMIRLAFASVADLAILPQQDVAGAGEEARMNTPGVAAGNWGFRLTPGMATAAQAQRLKHLAWVYGRAQ